MELERRAGQTKEEYAAEQKEKFEEGLAGLREYGPGGSGSQVEGWQKYKEGKEDRESKRISDIRTEQLIENQRRIDDESSKLSGDKPNATTASGDADFVNTAEKVARENLEKKQALEAQETQTE